MLQQVQSLREYLKPGTIVTSLFFILMLVSATLTSIILQGLFVIVAAALAGLVYRDALKFTSGEKNILIALIVVTGLILPINAFRTPTTVVHFAMMIACIGGSLFAVRDHATYNRASFVVLAFAQASILAFLVLQGPAEFPLENMFEVTSSNGITSILICVQINLCIANMLVSRKSCLVTASITLYICIIGYGRGSIIAAGMVWAMSALFFSASLERTARLVIGGAVAAVLGYVGLTSYGAITDFLDTSTKIGMGLFDDARAAINAEYWSLLTGINIIIGASFEGTMVDRFFNGNPHNSYIRAHHFLGLPYIFIMTALAGRSLLLPAPLVFRFYFGAMMAILLFRASTEPVLFPTPLDLLYFSLFFLFRPGSTQARTRPAASGGELVQRTNGPNAARPFVA